MRTNRLFRFGLFVFPLLALFAASRAAEAAPCVGVSTLNDLNNYTQSTACSYTVSSTVTMTGPVIIPPQVTLTFATGGLIVTAGNLLRIQSPIDAPATSLQYFVGDTVRFVYAQPTVWADWFGDATSMTIQRAFDAVPQLGVVRLSSRTYTVWESIHATASLNGAGWNGRAVLQVSPSAPEMLNILEVSGYSNWTKQLTISDTIFVGNGDPHNYGRGSVADGVALVQSSNVYLIGDEVRNVKRHGFYLILSNDNRADWLTASGMTRQMLGCGIQFEGSSRNVFNQVVISNVGGNGVDLNYFHPGNQYIPGHTSSAIDHPIDGLHGNDAYSTLNQFWALTIDGAGLPTGSDLDQSPDDFYGLNIINGSNTNFFQLTSVSRLRDYAPCGSPREPVAIRLLNVTGNNFSGKVWDPVLGKDVISLEASSGNDVSGISRVYSQPTCRAGCQAVSVQAVGQGSCTRFDVFANGVYVGGGTASTASGTYVFDAPITPADIHDLSVWFGDNGGDLQIPQVSVTTPTVRTATCNGGGIYSRPGIGDIACSVNAGWMWWAGWMKFILP